MTKSTSQSDTNLSAVVSRGMKASEALGMLCKEQSALSSGYSPLGIDSDVVTLASDTESGYNLVVGNARLVCIVVWWGCLPCIGF